MTRPQTWPIVFLSDYGLSDPFVGACHAVIAAIDPGILVIDLHHEVPPFAIRRGALALANAAPYLPAGAVVLAVVDPGVGGARREVAVEAGDGRRFVGPDNGLLAPALRVCGGATGAVNLERSPARLAQVSRTFHGRDVFAPIAARLALGATATELGEPIDPATLIDLALPIAEWDGDTLVAHVLDIDRFGNVRLDATLNDLPGAAIPETPAGVATFTIEVEGAVTALPLVDTFGSAPPGEPLMHVDANGALAIAINQGSATARFGVEIDQVVRIRRA